MSSPCTRIALIATAMLSLGASTAVQAAPQKFTFRNLEFGSRDKRVPRAQAYVARTMAPGTSMASAIDAAKNAGARCAEPADGSVLCTANFMQHRSGEGMSDIQWRVRLVASPDGQSVARSSVRRSTN
ncbi:hypothetical protein [Acetobacter oeni]|uniref:DUF4189 domain-containing protein n=1 Tax=Acetobacter oeni TaxID=304077 RepID=A0A511XPR0_9PROT|nr:hypothetical protein [Acetobacter oeni]MBB3884636.1 hypothetical protein [Acetobacter oeni]NHO20601.1 hypothetical protein [Acetobacter oeni]GEN64886.1 hypothetical protein AOE01nite_31100 [Acetobacter oeni]